MRLLVLAAIAFTTATPALAQRQSVQSQSLPPLQQQDVSPSANSRQAAPGQGGQTQNSAPSSQGSSGQGASSQGQSGAELPNVWMPAQTAQLQALDKVNAQATALTIKVGQSATVGSLTIMVKACLIRPTGQPADAAAYLDVTDSHPDSSGFTGWMLQAEPSVSMMQHPIYDLRVTGCA